MDLGFTPIAAIVVICYLVAEAVKNTQLDNKWLPVIAGTLGGILGAVGMTAIPDFPVQDIFNAIAVGIVSGLAAVGVNQIFKQFTKSEDGDE